MERFAARALVPDDPVQIGHVMRSSYDCLATYMLSLHPGDRQARIRQQFAVFRIVQTYV